MNNIILAISGAAHSGKTTAIEQLVKDLGEDRVVHNTEIIRDKKINIDEIRKDPIKYLDFEIEVIGEKILQEEKANEENEGKIIFFDRSLIDSYFYFTFYLDKSSFDEINLKKYHEFLGVLTSKINIHIKELYNMIFIFEPIKKQSRFDEYTQKHLGITQENENVFITNMTYGFAHMQNHHGCTAKIMNINIQSDYNILYGIINNLAGLSW